MNRRIAMSIDFGPSFLGWLMGHASSPPWRVGTLLLSVVALVMLCGVFWSEWAWQNEAQAMEANLQAARAQVQAHERAALAGKPVVQELTVVQRRRLDDLVQQLNTPWPSIFDLVERTKVVDVALIGLEPNAKSQSMRLTLEGKGLEELYAYTTRLSQTPEVAQVQLLRHERQDNAPQQPVRLTADVQWRAGVLAQKGGEP
jgi:hypothetical protein